MGKINIVGSKIGYMGDNLAKDGIFMDGVEVDESLVCVDENDDWLSLSKSAVRKNLIKTGTIFYNLFKNDDEIWQKYNEFCTYAFDRLDD